MESLEFKNKFWQDCAELPICQIADQIPGLYLFAKDLEGRHVLGNKRTLERCGCSCEEELIGKTDYDFYPPDLSAKYAEDDRQVIESGEATLELSELALNDLSQVDWFITSKFPIHNKSGQVVGIIGTTIEFNKSHTSYSNYSDIFPAVEHLRTHFMTNIAVQELADKVNLSVRQFQRKFKERFHLNVREYIIRLRLQKACDLLKNTDKSMVDIAGETGFYDQSSFTRQFKAHIAKSPLKYRKSR
ncbi:MAG: AraC family transcriptional regulator [Lentisphaeraceae bacterium]|nr:AraC family transcriptional regulator [Lentisphaeraceae bacterium]